MGRQQPGDKKSDFDIREKIIQISRVTKVVKGGKNMSFRATVVVGDGKGKIGMGLGKSEEVPKAIRKAIQIAQKKQIEFQLIEGTVAHTVIGEMGAGRVLIRPASPGTGVIAGGAVRAVLEMAGVTDVVAKSLGSRNPINVAQATINGLEKLMNVSSVSKARGVTPTIQFLSDTAREKYSQVEVAPQADPVAEKVEAKG